MLSPMSYDIERRALHMLTSRLVVRCTTLYSTTFASVVPAKFTSTIVAKAFMVVLILRTIGVVPENNAQAQGCHRDRGHDHGFRILGGPSSELRTKLFLVGGSLLFFTR